MLSHFTPGATLIVRQYFILFFFFFKEEETGFRKSKLVAQLLRRIRIQIWSLPFSTPHSVWGSRRGSLGLQEVIWTWDSLFLRQEINGNSEVNFFRRKGTGKSNSFNCMCKNNSPHLLSNSNMPGIKFGTQNSSQAQVFCIFILWTWKLKPREAETHPKLKQVTEPEWQTSEAPILHPPQLVLSTSVMYQQLPHPRYTYAQWMVRGLHPLNGQVTYHVTVFTRFSLKY